MIREQGDCYRSFHGIVESYVMACRLAYEETGLLNERVQAAERDLYDTGRNQEQAVGDIRPSMVRGGGSVRHFIRARLNEKGEPFACGHPTMSMDDTWNTAERARPWYWRQECSSQPPSLELIVTRRVGTPLKTLVRKSGCALAWRWPYVKSEEIVARYRRQFQVLELARTSSGAWSL